MRRYLRYTYASKVRDVIRHNAEEEVREFVSPAEFLAFCEAMERLKQDDHDSLVDFSAQVTDERPYDLRTALPKTLNWEDVETQITP